MSLHYSLVAPPAPLSSPLADETLIQACLFDAQPQAMLWSSFQSLVVPRSYVRFTAFQHASQTMKAEGWPVYVRQSGGGVVPQLPGMLNLSLCWADYGRPLDLSNLAYEHLCSVIQRSLHRQGVAAETTAVEGSFCDGRYNLAVKSTDGTYAKIAGTAQHWVNARSAPWYQNSARRAGDPTDWHIVLAHALLCIESDLVMGTEQANKLELLLGSQKRYDDAKVLSLSDLGLNAYQFEQDLNHILLTSFPPAGHHPVL